MLPESMKQKESNQRPEQAFLGKGHVSWYMKNE